MHSRRSASIAARLAGLRADRTFAVVDLVLVAASYLVVIEVDRANAPADHTIRHVAFALLIAVVLHLLSNAAWGLYGRVWRFASIDEARRLLAAGVTVSVILLVLVIAGVSRVDPLAAVGGPLAASFLLALSRFRSRLFAWQRDGGEPGKSRIAVIGVGIAGATVIREMLWDPSCGMRAVVALDDDPRKHGRLISNVPVAGEINLIPRIVADRSIDRVLLAITDADSALMSRVASLCEQAGVPLQVLPDLKERAGGRSSLRQVRDLRIEDLVGRKQVTTDYAAVAEMIVGKCVLVTGAGGSIGSEIVRQLDLLQPDRLILLDRDETLLHDCMASIDGRATDVLADIRDGHAIHELVGRFRPDVIFHAAALKHVPILERFPVEAALTNVRGTLNLVRAAVDADVDRFVFISTDKAVRPVSALGTSKWLGEQIVSHYGRGRAGYACVRFGNVLGSRGSVVPTFRRQIAAGGPVTVTDTATTRFFMSVEEAVALVLQAAVFAEGSDLFVLEMGEPVNIYQLAKRMIRLAGCTEHDVPIEITGYRPGEKVEEILHLPDDALLRTMHPSITRLVPRRLTPSEPETGLARLMDLVADNDENATRASMLELSQLVYQDRNATISLLATDADRPLV